MPTEFRYLVNSERRERRADRPAVEDRYNLEALARRPVIRDELKNRYLVFESRQEFLEWYSRLPPAERCCHEVIFGRHPQRLKFDIDAPRHKLDALPEQVLATALVAAADALSSEAPPAAADAVVRGDALAEYLDELLRPAEYAREEPAGLIGPPAPGGSAASKIQAIVGLLLEAILDELYVAYYGIEDLLPTRDDLVVTESDGPTPEGWKYSYHILVLPYAVADNVEASEFTARVLERLPPAVRGFVDPNVNKRIQNFRLAGSSKPGAARVKRATEEAARLYHTARNVPLEDLFVTAAAGARVLPRVYSLAEADPTAGRRWRPQSPQGPQPTVIRAALELAAREGVLEGHAFTEARGTLLCFERQAPSACRICNEVHHKDNSLMLSLDPVEGGHEGTWPGAGRVTCRLVEHCRQARGRGRAVGELTANAEELGGLGPAPRGRRPPAAAAPPLGLKELIAERVAALSAGQVNPHDALASDFERLPEAQKTVYSEPAMRAYELAPTLAVQAQMKLGKTKAMRHYLDAHFPANGLGTSVIRFVTFRQTFSRSLAEAFPDFALYSEVAGDLDAARQPRLIVQVESLHRLRVAANPEPIDLLVLDEVESVLAQFSSGLHRHFSAAFAVFQWMLKTARHVVCMDANLGDRTYHTLLRMRPAHPLHFHWNRYARAAGDAYRFTADQGAWLEALHAALRGGKRVVLPTNSLAEARAYHEALRREFPAKSVMVYSSETAPSEKARHFGDVHTHWGGLDVLIYTPTCSAGISFERAHFDVLFGDFCDTSCDVETCRQMLGRVRDIGAREYTICLRATGAALPATTDEIRRLLYDKRAGLYRSIEDAALQYEFEPDGTLRFYESDYFHLWLETTRVANLSRNNFARRFIDQVADTGAQVGLLTSGPAAAGAALLTSHRETRLELKAARHAAIAAAADLEPEAAADIREALQGQQDVDPARLLALDKYQLREAYAWHGRPLDAAFVEAYQGADARRVYRNLRRITEGATVLESLQRLQRSEAGHYMYAMEGRAGTAALTHESRDLLRDRTLYSYQSHYFAIWLLRLCGFAFAGKARVHEAALEARLRAALPGLKAQLRQIIFEFEVPRPALERLGREADRRCFLAGMLRFVNSVLRKTYGLQIQRVTKHAGGDAYFLNQSPVGRLFALKGPEDGGGDEPEEARPLIHSNLVPPAARRGGRADHRVDLFLEAVYYSSEASEGAAAPPEDPDGAPGGPP